MLPCSLDRRALASASVRPISASVPAITGRRNLTNSVVLTSPWSVLASSRTVPCILPALVVRHQPRPISPGQASDPPQVFATPAGRGRSRQHARPRSLPRALGVSARVQRLDRRRRRAAVRLRLSALGAWWPDCRRRGALVPVRLPTPRTTWGTSTSVTGPVLSIPRDRDPAAGVVLLSAVGARPLPDGVG